MPPAITSRRVLIPGVIVMLLASSLLPAEYCFYGPPLHNAVLVLVSPLSGRISALGSRLYDRSGPPIDRTLEQLRDDLLVLEGENRRLQEENRMLRDQITQLSGLQRRIGPSKYRPIFARVTGHSVPGAGGGPGGGGGGAMSGMLLIDAGIRDGLDVGMVVADVGAGGFGGPQLVGRIVQVQHATAAVEPITAKGNLLRLELSSAPERWVLFRAAGPDLLIAADADRDMPVKVGDLARLADPPLVGAGRVWPPAAHFMLIGTVTRIVPDPNEPLWQRIEVRPTRPLTHLSEVMVLIPAPHGPTPGDNDGSEDGS